MYLQLWSCMGKEISLNCGIREANHMTVNINWDRRWIERKKTKMIEVVVATAVLVIGSLLVVQTFIMRSCFQVGQPQESSHFSNEVLTNEKDD